MTNSTVFLIGAGPGDPGLMTVRGLQCLESADVVLYDHLVPARAAPSRTGRRRKNRRRNRRAAAARAGSHLLSARRESARRQERGEAQVGRPVCVRQRRLRGAVPARAGRPFRSRSWHPGGDRRAGLRRHSDHLSRRRRHAHLRSRTRRRRQGTRVDRLGQPGSPRRHHRLLRGPGAIAGIPGRADVTRPSSGRFSRDRLRRHACRRSRL